MKKKYLMFGLLGLFAVALVSAGLVGYLSNTVKADVEVSSPIQQWIAMDGETWDDDNIISFDIYGGETVDFSVRDTNLANVLIVGEVNNIITNPTGVTCNDFISVIVTTTSLIDGVKEEAEGQPNPSGPHDLIYYNSIDPTGRFCEDVGTDGNTIVFSYGPDPLTLEVGQEDTSEISVTFKTDALGVYTFQSTIVPVTE